MNKLIALDVADLAIAAGLLLIDAALSIWLRLRLEGKLLIAALRMVAQLLLIGLVLKGLFALTSPLWTGVAALIMILFAGWEALARQERRFSGIWGYGLGTTAMMTASILVTVFALTTQVRPDPWFDPRYAIPMLGMILGNTMTGVSLGLHSLSTGAWQNRRGIEARLALGANRWEAMRPISRAAMTNALMPSINAMSASGIVYLPGMMTGQIISGIDPMEAVKYQILIMFLIVGGTGFGSVVAVFGGVLRLTDNRHRLRLDRLAAARA
ncbi:MAG: iron export ABC transporter permease subunit FetB [Rhodospirillaceae bacterium]|nr:iron export ABC transporter permease subunit FetB [Rhodospirillaceae bacterium]